MEVSKNFSTAASSKDGELLTSTTTWVLVSGSANPAPVSVSTPVAGEAGTASCSRSLFTTFVPISPVPPMTTIFMTHLSSTRAQGIERPHTHCAEDLEGRLTAWGDCPRFSRSLKGRSLPEPAREDLRDALRIFDVHPVTGGEHVNRDSLLGVMLERLRAHAIFV